jgi:hypothetical protein
MSARLTATLPGLQSTPPSLLPESYADVAVLEQLRQDFARWHYVALPGLLPPSLFTQVKAEVARLERFARSRNFVMDVAYHTPRIMKTLGGQEIHDESPFLSDLYEDLGLRNVLSHVAGQSVYTCHDVNEWMVCNWLAGEGRTHGWHLDDPPLALVVFLEAPAPGEGGALEFIEDWHALCTLVGEDPLGDINSLVERCRAAGLVREKIHVAGDAYLLRADLFLHRVAPLRRDGARRTVLNMAFELLPGMQRRGITADLLYA